MNSAAQCCRIVPAVLLEAHVNGRERAIEECHAVDDEPTAAAVAAATVTAEIQTSLCRITRPLLGIRIVAWLHLSQWRHYPESAAVVAIAADVDAE
jgi:hypothetical protein